MSTLQPTTPLDLTALSGLARNCPDAFLDWLVERQVPMVDVLLLYARDSVACPNREMSTLTFGPAQEPEWLQLLAAPFPESLLARYLGMVNDGRAGNPYLSAWIGKANFTSRWVLTWQADEDVHSSYHPTESAARLDLKRRVLGLFGAEHGRVVTLPDGRIRLVEPKDFLPAQPTRLPEAPRRPLVGLARILAAEAVDVGDELEVDDSGRVQRVRDGGNRLPVGVAASQPSHPDGFVSVRLYR